MPSNLVETHQTQVREAEHDKSHPRINIQTLGIDAGASCKQSQRSRCDQDSFLAENILQSGKQGSNKNHTSMIV